MLQDSQGMIWLGTKSGLARYDGNTLEPITLDSSIADNEVTALFEDKNKTLWVGTVKGRIYKLDLSRIVHAFDIEEGHPEKKITSILQDPNGQIWFATYGEGVYVYTGTRLFNFNVDDGLTSDDIYSMTSTHAGEIWLGTDDGINICTFDKEIKQIRSLGKVDGLPEQIITVLKADDHDNIWIGTYEYGVVYYDASLQKVRRLFESEDIDEVTALEIFDGEEIWIGTLSSGVWRYHPQYKFMRKLVSLEYIKPFEVSDILADVEGNIWIAADEGVLLSGFRPFESITTNLSEIQTLFCDHLDRVWVGTNKGLYTITENSQNLSQATRVIPSFDFSITGIVEDNYNNLWIGTLDKGLYIYTPTSGKVIQISAAVSRLGTAIMSMDRTKEKIWIATQQGTETGYDENPFTGVFSYPGDKDITKDNKYQFQLIDDPWKSNLDFVYQVKVDSKDRTWFATDGNGVYSLEPDGSKSQYEGDSSLDLRIVYSICEDQRNVMWFTAPKMGIIEFDHHTYKPLDLDGGMASLDINSIATTKNGDILMAHNGGIDLMKPESKHFIYYTSEIGVENFEPGINSIATDSRGNIYVGGKNIIMKYYATNKELSFDPQTQLTEVSVNQKPVDFMAKHSFAHNENYFTFHFKGLWYTSPQSVTYQYKLDDYDKEFKESKDNTATYSRLPPGDYVFHVKASENKDFFDEQIASFSFTIAKPFYRQVWFVVLMIGLTMLLFYWLVKTRDMRVSRNAMMKKEMIESQLQALKAQINPHFLFNSFNTLITIIDENARKPQVAIEYVEKLSDFFRNILLYREQETVTLEEEWEMVQNYGYLLQKRYGSTLRLHLSPPLNDGFILPLTLQILVENAVKHNVITRDKPLDVYITIDNDQYVTVKNNLQPKSQEEPSTQFGLQSIIKRYQLMSERKVLVEKTDYSFSVRIPILKKQSE